METEQSIFIPGTFCAMNWASNSIFVNLPLLLIQGQSNVLHRTENPGGGVLRMMLLCLFLSFTVDFSLIQFLLIQSSLVFSLGEKKHNLVNELCCSDYVPY